MTKSLRVHYVKFGERTWCMWESCEWMLESLFPVKCMIMLFFWLRNVVCHLMVPGFTNWMVQCTARGTFSHTTECHALRAVSRSKAGVFRQCTESTTRNISSVRSVFAHWTRVHSKNRTRNRIATRALINCSVKQWCSGVTPTCWRYSLCERKPS